MEWGGGSLEYGLSSNPGPGTIRSFPLGGVSNYHGRKSTDRKGRTTPSRKYFTNCLNEGGMLVKSCQTGGSGE